MTSYVPILDIASLEQRDSTRGTLLLINSRVPSPWPSPWSDAIVETCTSEYYADCTWYHALTVVVARRVSQWHANHVNYLRILSADTVRARDAVSNGGIIPPWHMECQLPRSRYIYIYICKYREWPAEIANNSRGPSWPPNPWMLKGKFPPHREKKAFITDSPIIWVENNFHRPILNIVRGTTGTDGTVTCALTTKKVADI